MAALLGLQRSLIAFGARGQGVEQVAKFAQRVGGDQRRTDNEGGTSSTQHPRGQRAGAALHLDEDDFAVGKFLASMDRQALSVEGVPAIVDRYDFGLRKMMGIM